VKLLETAANSLEIEFIDGVMTGAKRGPQGISEIVLEDSRTLSADFYIDASGFRRELIGKTLNEPFIGYENSLFNDRAVLGSWQIEPGEVILPYTTAETMNSGWAWRIDHQDSVNRGYVYSSAHISDEEAQAEFAAKNPRAKLWNKVIKFRTGRFERCWVENVLGLGNAYAFVEPLESTALMAVCTQCMMFCDLVKLAGPSEQVRAVYNRSIGNYWDEIRSFLTLHFKLNTRLNTPYWIRCRQEADTPQLRPIVEFYQDVGPSGFNRYNLVNHESAFGMEGYLVQFVGNRFPYRNRHVPTDAEARFVKQMREKNLATAKKGLSANEALTIIKHPNWRWTEELPRATGKTG
jgi:tryptophan halogenase